MMSFPPRFSGWRIAQDAEDGTVSASNEVSMSDSCRTTRPMGIGSSAETVNSFDRRTMLTAALAAIAVGLSGTTVRAQYRSAPILERRRASSRSPHFVARVTRRAGPTSCPRISASPPSTTTARCGSSSRCMSSSRSSSTASRRWRRRNPDWKNKQPFKAVLDGDMKALAASGEKGLVETHGGDARRHDHRRV